MAKLVGLTGGIGSGKSTVAAQFAALGVTRIDTDQISRELSAADGAAMSAIQEMFGSSVIAPDGSLDRAAMRSRVFADPTARLHLESILHPLIALQVAARVDAAADHVYVLLEVPLLFETMRYRRLLLAAIVVDCPRQEQIRRVMQRSQLTESEVSPIIDAQLPRDVKLQLADYVVCNTQPIAALQEVVRSLHAKLLERCHEEVPQIRG